MFIPNTLIKALEKVTALVVSVPIAAPVPHCSKSDVAPSQRHPFGPSEEVMSFCERQRPDWQESSRPVEENPVAPTPGQAAPSTTMFWVTVGAVEDAIRSAAEALIAKSERTTNPRIFFMTDKLLRRG